MILLLLVCAQPVEVVVCRDNPVALTTTPPFDLFLADDSGTDQDVGRLLVPGEDYYLWWDGSRATVSCPATMTVEVVP